MSATPQAQRVQALFGLVVANFFWGVSFPVIKAMAFLHAELVPAGGTWFSTLYTVAPRFLLGALVLLAVQGRGALRLTRGEWQQGGLIAIFLCGGMVLQNDGLQFTAASTSAFLTQLYAILIPLVLAVRHRRNPGAGVWVSCALVLGGVAILGRFDWRTFTLGRGELETLLSSVCFMVQIFFLGSSRFAGNRPEKITFVMFAVLAVACGGAAVAAAPDAAALVRPWTSPAWLGFTLVLTVFCTLGSFILMNTWQPKISTTEAGLIYCIEPIFASLLALFLPGWFSHWVGFDYPNETATWTLLLGGGLITAANLLLQLRPPRVSAFT